jgi:pyridoxal phosphate enzyme (YggS family)
VGGDRIAENLAAVRERIARAAERVGRDPGSVGLVAVTKGVPPERVRRAVEAGATDLGENYVQELRAKRAAVPGARWHFIGTLQSHTAHRVAELADVVQTLAGERATERLARRAAGAGRRLPALIEVDLAEGRAGVPPEALETFADRAVRLEGIEVVGLMTIPPIPASPEDARPFFRRLRELRDRLRERHPRIAELSMGMSLDYEVAVEEGATMVRVGTALFGPRPPEA